MIHLKGEQMVEMGILNGEVTFDLSIGKNVQFLKADNYTTTRASKNATSIEWMIAGGEALKDILVRIDLKRGYLGQDLKKRLVSEWASIQEKASEISNIVSRGEKKLINTDILHKGKDICITVKTVKGKYRPCYPTVNIVIPLNLCKEKKIQKGLKYYVKLSVDTAIELAYKVLYWITATEISESKRAKTAEMILGKLF